MTLRREDIPSLKYWAQDEKKVCQRFYLAFCLLTSSVQDIFLGLREYENKNFNWSVICSYYGLVHGGRLLSFLAIGDFPTQHNELGNLFVPPRPQPRPNPKWWLYDFVPPEETGSWSLRKRGVPKDQSISDYQQFLVSYLEKISVSDAGI